MAWEAEVESMFAGLKCPSCGSPLRFLAIRVAAFLRYFTDGHGAWVRWRGREEIPPYIVECPICSFPFARAATLEKAREEAARILWGGEE